MLHLIKEWGFVFSAILQLLLVMLKKYSVGKVLIVDWNVHHGNGT